LIGATLIGVGIRMRGIRHREQTSGRTSPA